MTDDCIVVIADDGRHSLWPARRPLPWGWRPEGFRGTEAACLAHVAAVWTELGAARAATTEGRDRA